MRFKKRKLFKGDKETILEEQGYRCAYCATDLDVTNTEFDHFVPRAARGLNTAENIFACCQECNRAKSNNVFGSFEEARQWLYDLRVRRRRKLIDSFDIE
jgi:5-methylcytosine-specific restriction endonuclease McrA